MPPPPPVPATNNDSQVTLRGTAAQVPTAQVPAAQTSDGRVASVPETPMFGPMSPGPGDMNEYFGTTSSPEPMPSTVPSTRRSSSAYYGCPSLSRLTSNASEVSDSVFSERSAAPFAELDRKLEKLVFEEEPEKVKDIAAADIPTEIPDKLKRTPYAFDCAFGWTGNHSEDLEDQPITKKAFVKKLADAKEGTEFIANALIAYQHEINSRRHHKFPAGFLAHQNHAIVVTNDQLDTINGKLDAVVAEVKAIPDNDENIEEGLVDAYKHAAPWVKRTTRIIYDAHVFYKLNYTMGAHSQAAKKKSSPVSFLGPVRLTSDIGEVGIPGSLRNAK